MTDLRYSSRLLRIFIGQYEKDRQEALDSGDVHYVKFCDQKLERYRAELPHVELIEKLEWNV